MKFPNVLHDETTMGPKNEHDLKKRVDDVLRARRPLLWYLKVHGHSMQRAHVPDFIGWYFGIPFAIELKNPNEKPEPTVGQGEEMKWQAKAGAKTICTNSLDEVRDFLEQIRREHYL